jgi:hypothetical protein
MSKKNEKKRMYIGDQKQRPPPEPTRKAKSNEPKKGEG